MTPAVALVAAGTVLSVLYLSNVHLVFASGRSEGLAIVTPTSLLIGTGAAALLASGVLGYLALRQESKARALQDQPGAGRAFEDIIAKRNGLRLAAAISGGVGVTATLSGALSLATEGYGPVRSVAAPVGGPSRHGAVFYGIQLSGAL